MNNWDLLFLHQEPFIIYFKAGVHVNFTKFKEGLKGKKTSVETPPHSWTPPKGHPRLVGNCLMYVYQFVTSNSIFKRISDLQNFLFPKIALLLWKKLFTPPYIQKSPSNLQKIPKRKHLTSREIFDRLKPERDICVETKPSQDTAFRFASASNCFKLFGKISYIAWRKVKYVGLYNWLCTTPKYIHQDNGVT